MKKKTIVTIILGAAVIAAGVAYAVTKINRLDCDDYDEDFDEDFDEDSQDECYDKSCETCDGENCGQIVDEEIEKDFDADVDETQQSVEETEETEE